MKKILALLIAALLLNISSAFAGSDVKEHTVTTLDDRQVTVTVESEKLEQAALKLYDKPLSQITENELRNILTNLELLFPEPRKPRVVPVQPRQAPVASTAKNELIVNDSAALVKPAPPVQTAAPVLPEPMVAEPAEVNSSPKDLLKRSFAKTLGMKAAPYQPAERPSVAEPIKPVVVVPAKKSDVIPAKVK